MNRPDVDEIARTLDVLFQASKREAALIDEMEAAVEVGDRDLVWQLARELCRLQGEAKSEEPLPPAAA